MPKSHGERRRGRRKVKLLRNETDAVSERGLPAHDGASDPAPTGIELFWTNALASFKTHAEIDQAPGGHPSLHHRPSSKKNAS